MEVTCANCNSLFKGHYCNNCGQAAKTGRLSAHSVWHEVEHALIHLDKGVLYTARQLFTRPGHSIREFIEGKRVRHFKPLSLVVVLTTVLALLYHYFKISLIPEQTYAAATSEKDTVTIEHVNDWLTNHFSVTTIIFMLFSSLSTYLIFMKRGYNFVEYLFMQAFITSQHLMVQLLLFPLNYALYKTSAYSAFTFSISIINLGLSIWVFIQFFHTQPKVKVFFLSLLSYFTAIFFLVIMSIVLAKTLSLLLHPA